jgi:hypothetical protein
MPSRAPSHRWVDMGDHHRSQTHRRSTAHVSKAHVSHRTSKATKRTASSHHRTAPHRTSKSRHAAVHHKASPALSKKAIRRCHSMTYRQLLRHKDCAQLLQTEIKSAAHPKHRLASRKSAARNHHKTATKHHTAVRHHETRHSKSKKRHRS